jgi:hypothetical protein
MFPVDLPVDKEKCCATICRVLQYIKNNEGGMSMSKSRICGIIGFWAFVVGLVISIICGIVAPADPIVILILVILGIIIGVLNITTKEIVPLLLAVVALVVVGNVFAPIKTLAIGAILGNILSLLATLMAPAAIIAAVKTLWVVGFPSKDK